MAVGGVEAIPFGVLVFVAGSLLAANVWGVVDARLATTAAAREAARSYVEAPDASAAERDAAGAARQALAGYGRDPDRLRLQVDRERGRAWGRCVRVTVLAGYSVPVAAIPWVGGWGEGVEVSSSHSELVDPHRAGIPGAAACS